MSRIYTGKMKKQVADIQDGFSALRKTEGNICGYVLFRHEKFPALSGSKYEYCSTSEQTITFLKSLSLVVREILYKAL